MSEVNDEAAPAKVQKLSSEAIHESDSSLIDKTQKILANIGSCQTEIDSLNEQASEEILKVEQKYNKLRRPHFEKRNQLIDDIPNFWVTTLVNHPQLGCILAEEDVQCLHYLKQLSVEEYEDIKSGYKISFTFSKNPFFTNDVLTKEFHLSSSSKGSPYTKSTPVYWNDNMDLTDRSKLSPRGKKRKRGQSSSFFSWFKASTDPTSDELAEVLKDDIWPNPLQYYLRSPEINGISDDSSDDSDGGLDDSVVVVGDDDDDDEDDVYEVDHDDSDDDDLDDSHILGLTGDSIQLVDDDDDDDDDEVEVISDVEEIMDSSKDIGDIGETTLETTQDITADSILDDTADDEILESTGDDILEDTVDDSILNDTADASIDNLDETCGTSNDKNEKDSAEKVTQELAEEEKDANLEVGKEKSDDVEGGGEKENTEGDGGGE